MITAAFILVAVQIIVSLFQLALVLGAPMGEYTLGGQTQGKLSVKLRLVSAISLLLNLAIAGHYLAQTGTIQTLLPSDLNQIANWGLVVFTAGGLVMNSISRSKKERKMWVPVLLLSLTCAVVVAIG
ncbi:MAG: hypothetical protein KAZ95_00355 [Rhodoluna sp.]|jgi:hypothetical protein|nr:hypothetical protein [Rhodoluna sp.]